jgi:hypothetical protein
MLKREAANINFIAFCLTRPGIVHTTYRTQGEHAYVNNYNALVVVGCDEGEWSYKYIGGAGWLNELCS